MYRFMLLIVAAALLATACRETTAAPSTVPETMPAGSEMDAMSGGTDDMNAMGMNMGNAAATPAEEVPGADLVEGTFVLLDTRPQGYEDLTGTAVLARHDAGTTVTLRLEGLLPGTDFISHVHDGSCADSGGDHYRFDPEGSDVPPNEIHLAFTSDITGSGFMTAENDATVDDRAVSVVVHPRDLIDNKIACAEFRR